MKKKKENEMLEREKKLLAREVYKVQEEMAAALSCFSDVIEPELVDYYTYCYKANEIKHSYLLKKLKRIYYNRN
ncbi:DUF2508 family protein [Cellulosilyticum sp. I15G10I2]|uniref:DUF2508 family protein n=1 Tax=Cellulosilyticum sp. I15G10I2 TaxID=1892843 RepID=UPI00085CDF5A|nr:DUF2508 family protein [Cellulosilyticum sp. I15G10I2]